MELTECIVLSKADSIDDFSSSVYALTQLLLFARIIQHDGHLIQAALAQHL